MGINERYRKAVKEIDEYFENVDYEIKDKKTYEQTLLELKEFFDWSILFLGVEINKTDNKRFINWSKLYFLINRKIIIIFFHFFYMIAFVIIIF